ncbi:ABC transporter substrate-binding protein [Oceanivirga salmonicida]|uniref:ABC transporter substrate-binding protein n=1 Tax=Oceanivirga salmonicida TaxID=1769291 RepID=UPI0008364776|nr:ABC transporter substrate-binding protein [Oceanivirga salmonicida]
MKKLLTSIFLIGLAFSCGGNTEANVKSEEKLVFYAGLQEDHAAMVAQEFTKETGIPAEFVRLSSGETLARLKAEKNNMVASVWYGGPVDGIIAADAEGLIEPYVSKTHGEIKPQFKSGDDGRWTGIYVGYLGFVGNKKVLEEKGIKMPQSWQDLLDPKLKGEIVVAHPGSSGTAYTMLATLVQLMGEDEAMEYFKKLNGQIRQYTKSGTAPGRMVGSGEAAIGITFLHDAIKYQKEGYSDIIIAAPSEGTGYEIGAVALLKNAPNPEAAKKFIDWVLTKEVQEKGQTVGSFQFLTNENAVNPKEADPIKDTKLIKYDFEWAGMNRKQLVERFTRETSSAIPTK